MAMPSPNNDKPEPAGNIGPFGAWKGRRTIRWQMTPELAQWVLDNLNLRNRPLREADVNRYASDMLAGQWRDNGATIGFDWNGILTDGQHRLHACVRTGFAFTIDIALGLDPAAFDTIDQGRLRDKKQVLSLAHRDLQNATVVSSVATIVYLYEQGVRSFYQTKKTPPVTSPQLVRFLDERPGLIESASFGARKGTGGSRRPIEAYPKVTGFCHYLFGQRDAGLRDYFFQALETGVGLDAGDPILALRRKLAGLTNDLNKKKTGVAHATQLQAQWMVRAWNHAKAGRSTTGLNTTYASDKRVMVGPIPDID